MKYLSSRLKETLEHICPVSEEDLSKARARLDSLTKPQGSLGRLEGWAERLYAIQPRLPLTLSNKRVFVLAADHGVAQEGVSAYPQSVTREMVRNFLAGGAAINVLARQVDAQVTVVDMGIREPLPPDENLVVKRIAEGTANMLWEPAMTHQEALRAIEAGIELVEEAGKNRPDLVAVGEMGIANTTSASALISSLTKVSPDKTTGRGTGIEETALTRKIEIIRKALERHKPDSQDPLDCLAKVGGFEIAGIAGIVLACARRRIPVIVDGLISTAGCLVAVKLRPEAAHYIFMSHLSREPGHRVALNTLKQETMLDMEMRLGEGSGAALAMGILDAAAHLFSDMATFEEAGVSKKENI